MVLRFQVVPETLVKFYSLEGITGSSKSTQGVGEFQNEPSYTPSDLTTFATSVGETIAAPTVVGPFSAGNDPESSLDIMVRGGSFAP